MPISKHILQGSRRLKESGKRCIIDEASRKRRHRKTIELLEENNYHEDPHSDLVMSKRVPKFDNNLETRSRNKKKEKNPDYYQMKFRKNFLQLVEEDRVEADASGRYSYMDATCEDTDLPYRHFCDVCGFFSRYVCLTCGTRFCSISCMGAHIDTRCLKWVA